jgi:AcrR family transcriptional regulator
MLVRHSILVPIGTAYWLELVLTSTNVKEMIMAASTTKLREAVVHDTAVRGRILEAAFAAFTRNGFAATSTLEIATRARVSKRELYATVGNKQEMLIACIRARAGRLQVPVDLPVPDDRATFARVLASFGAQLVREISHPQVVGVFRLAIAEAVRAPAVARALDSIGREASRTALRKIMLQAQASGLLKGCDASECTEQFSGLLWGTLMISLLLGTAERPSPREIASRARDAAAAFLQLHPPPDDAATPIAPK